MCCRYYIEPSDEFAEIIDEASESVLNTIMSEGLGHSLVMCGEVRPNDIAPVVAPNRNGTRAAFPMVWGFVLPSLKSPLFNARVETAASKPTFRDSWMRRRCAIPASHYFEWEHHLDPTSGRTRTGDRYAIHPSGSRSTWLAGLYRFENRNGITMPVFTILTREPAEGIRFIHNRMPVILSPDNVEEWVTPARNPLPIVSRALTHMEYTRG